MARMAFASVTDLPAGTWRWKNFNPVTEWASRDADGSRPIVIVPEFMDRLEQLRTACGFPLPLSSGYRSPAHNQAESSTGADGPHTTGMAADIRVSGPQAFTVIAKAIELGFTGIGVSQKGPHEKRFIHVDVAREAPAVWSY